MYVCNICIYNIHIYIYIYIYIYISIYTDTDTILTFSKCLNIQKNVLY